MPFYEKAQENTPGSGGRKNYRQGKAVSDGEASDDRGTGTPIHPKAKHGYRRKIY